MGTAFELTHCCEIILGPMFISETDLLGFDLKTSEINLVIIHFKVHLCEADPLIDNGSSFHSSFGRKTVVVKSLWKGVSQQKR